MRRCVIGWGLFGWRSTHRSGRSAHRAAARRRRAPGRERRANRTCRPAHFSPRSRSSRIFIWPDLVSQCLSGPGDVAVHLGLYRRLVDSRVVVEVIDHLLAGPVLAVDAGVNHQSDRAPRCRPPAGRSRSRGPDRSQLLCPAARCKVPSPPRMPCSSRACGRSGTLSSSCAIEICR